MLCQAGLAPVSLDSDCLTVRPSFCIHPSFRQRASRRVE
ncbi:hypothetical protein CCUS01_05695 [Colletotrichum cuscutae]|uniref:Uncharacterized protein n=1 Tax=Colletotrichum cuscutae TaxID=1209917 RepID=A0AAI9V6V7_9PEZI|nr:hypothetical protein CCUS01_05695 [Colletotrichum cuscutae]